MLILKRIGRKIGQKIGPKIGQEAIQIIRPNNANQGEISLFDVKELYDAAYAEKAKAGANIKKLRALLKQAPQLDLSYRSQMEYLRMMPLAPTPRHYNNKKRAA